MIGSLSAQWLTPEGVADALGISAEQGGSWLVLVTDAAVAFVERERPDLMTGSPPVFTPPADVVLGGTIHAVNLYRRRDTYAGTGNQVDDLGTLALLPSTDQGVDRLLGIGRWRSTASRIG